jgi:hypothetical protein
MEFNKYADTRKPNEIQAKLEALCRKLGNTELLPWLLSTTIRDDKDVVQELDAGQYVELQTEYLSLYWEYVGYALTDKRAASVSSAVEAAKAQARKDAIGKALSRMGISMKDIEETAALRSAGVSAQENILFSAALDVARGENNSLLQTEVIDILNGMNWLEDKEKSALFGTIYESQASDIYKTAPELNLYINDQRTSGKTDDSIKASITSAYKDMIIGLYNTGDMEGINQIVIKLGQLQLYDSDFNIYYTWDRIYGWIEDYLSKLYIGG